MHLLSLGTFIPRYLLLIFTWQELRKLKEIEELEKEEAAKSEALEARKKVQ